MFKRTMAILFSLWLIFSIRTIYSIAKIEKSQNDSEQQETFILVVYEDEGTYHKSTGATIETTTQTTTETVAETECFTQETQEQEETDTEATTEEITTESVTTDEAKYPQFADEEYLLAQIITCEVGGETVREMELCGSVILNRALTNKDVFKYVSSIEEVLYQGYGTSNQQYSSITISKIQNGKIPYDDAVNVAHGLIYGTIEIEPEILFQFDEGVSPWNGITEVTFGFETGCHYYKISD